MKDEIERIFKLNDPIKSFEGLRLASKNDLVQVYDLIKKIEYSNVHFINWSDENKNILNENAELKIEIYQKLVANMLRDNHLTIDLTNCDIDEQFLKCLADALETNHHIGALLLSQPDENRFDASVSRYRISEILERNNDNFSRFPSDYIHCLLASHCYTKRDKNTLEEKMNNLGWKVEEKLSLIPKEVEKGAKPKKYLSILYKNESTRQLVLAFRGIKLKVKDFFLGDSQLEGLVYGTLANEVISYSYYAYQHCKFAYEMSKSLKYNLSFTGYSFGAWLAEQSVYFCYKIFETRNVRAVTFDSPGSWEITQELADSHIHNRETDKNELGKLDIKTFLFSPNFMNTSKEHIGRVYRVFEKSLVKGDLDSDSVEVWDDFIMNKFISKIPSNPLKKMFENWYLKIVKASLVVANFGVKVVKKIAPKYLFYLNGIRALFSDDIKWLLGEFENDKIELKEVTRWPKMDFRPKSDRFDELNLAKNMIERIPIIGSIIPDKFKSLVSKPIDLGLNRIIRGVIKNCFSSLAILYNIIAEISTGGLNDEQCVLCFEYNQVTLDEKTLLGKEGFDLVFKGCYEVKTCNQFEYKLYLLDNTHLDNQIKAYFYDRNKFINHKLNDQFRKLDNKLHIESEQDGNYEVFRLQSKEKNVSVEVIRERFFRLNEINKVYERRYTKKITKLTESLGEEHRLDKMKNTSFVKEDDDIFKKIDTIIKKSQYCWIYGKSGYGKSTLAYEYGHYIKEFSIDYFVHLIDSKDEFENINELARRFLDLSSMEENKKADPKELVNIIRMKIRSFERKILFIFDDLTALKSIELILNTLNDHKFLITTQSHNLFKSDENGIKLNGYDENWCIEYLKINEIYSNKENEKWKELIRRCTKGKLSPKSLSDLINYKKEAKICSFEDYEKILNGDLFKKYEVIKEKNKLAFYILQHLAYLDGTGIDFTIINEMFENINGFERSLDYLVNYGYLTEEHTGEKISFIMDASTQDEIEKNCEKESELETIRLNIVEKINLMIEKEFETDIKIAKWSEKKKETIKELEKHGYKIFKKYKNFKFECSNSLLSNLLKINSIIFINYIKEEEIEKCILEIKNERLPSNDREIASSYNNIGSVLYKQSKYKESLECYKKSLSIRLEILPSNDPDIATSYNNIGSVLDKQGNFTEALKYHEKSLSIRKETLPSNDPDIATSYNNIACVLDNQGNFTKALKYYERSLSIRKETFTSNHPKIANSYNNIGSVLYKQSKYKESLECYKKSLSIRLETLPPNHPDIVSSYDNIGDVLDSQGEYTEALEYYKKSLSIRLEILPSNDPKIAMSYKNISSVLKNQRRYTESQEYLNKRISLWKKTRSNPSNHPNVPSLDDSIRKNLIETNYINESSFCTLV